MVGIRDNEVVLMKHADGYITFDRHSERFKARYLKPGHFGEPESSPDVRRVKAAMNKRAKARAELADLKGLVVLYHGPEHYRKTGKAKWSGESKWWLGVVVDRWTEKTYGGSYRIDHASIKVKGYRKPWDVRAQKLYVSKNPVADLMRLNAADGKVKLAQQKRSEAMKRVEHIRYKSVDQLEKMAKEQRDAQKAKKGKAR